MAQASPPPVLRATLQIMRDRRFEPRQESSVPVEVHWTDAAGPEQMCAGILRDFSRTGARIQIARPVRLQTFVRVIVRNTELKGRVHYCVRSLAGYMLGLQFEPESQGILKGKI